MTETNNHEGENTSLGACPNCDEMIPSENHLIKYEKEDEWPRLIAQCSECGDVVQPK